MNGHSRGFTLLELLIAIAVFALISLSGLQIVKNVYRADEISNEYTHSFHEMQLAMHLIGYDMVQMVPRTLRGGSGSREPALLVGTAVLNSEYEGIRFVRAGLANPQMYLPRSHLSRVGYRIYQGELQRLVWPVVDAPSNVEPVIQTIIKSASEMDFQFFNGKVWVRNWTSPSTVPLAIRMNVNTMAMGRIERVWLLKGPQMNVGQIQ